MEPSIKKLEKTLLQSSTIWALKRDFLPTPWPGSFMFLAVFSFYEHRSTIQVECEGTYC